MDWGSMDQTAETDQVAVLYMQKGKAKLERKKQYRKNRQKSKTQSKRWRARNKSKIKRYRQKAKRNPMQHRLKRRAGAVEAISFWDLSRDDGGDILEIKSDVIETTLGQYDPVEFLGQVALIEEGTEDLVIGELDSLLEYQEDEDVVRPIEALEKASAESVVRRFLAFKYQPKESKKSKVEKLRVFLQKTTGISKTLAKEVADAAVRGRDLPRLAVQKNWPVDEKQYLVGPQGKVSLSDLLSWI